MSYFDIFGSQPSLWLMSVSGPKPSHHLVVASSLAGLALGDSIFAVLENDD